MLKKIGLGIVAISLVVAPWGVMPVVAQQQGTSITQEQSLEARIQTQAEKVKQLERGLQNKINQLNEPYSEVGEEFTRSNREGRVQQGKSDVLRASEELSGLFEQQRSMLQNNYENILKKFRNLPDDTGVQQSIFDDEANVRTNLDNVKANLSRLTDRIRVLKGQLGVPVRPSGVLPGSGTTTQEILQSLLDDAYDDAKKFKTPLKDTASFQQLVKDSVDYVREGTITPSQVQALRPSESKLGGNIFEESGMSREELKLYRSDMAAAARKAQGMPAVPPSPPSSASIAKAQTDLRGRLNLMDLEKGKIRSAATIDEALFFKTTFERLWADFQKSAAAYVKDGVLTLADMQTLVAKYLAGSGIPQEELSGFRTTLQNAHEAAQRRQPVVAVPEPQRASSVVPLQKNIERVCEKVPRTAMPASTVAGALEGAAFAALLNPVQASLTNLFVGEGVGGAWQGFTATFKAQGWSGTAVQAAVGGGIGATLVKFGLQIPWIGPLLFGGYAVHVQESIDTEHHKQLANFLEDPQESVVVLNGFIGALRARALQERVAADALPANDAATGNILATFLYNNAIPPVQFDTPSKAIAMTRDMFAAGEWEQFLATLARERVVVRQELVARLTQEAYTFASQQPEAAWQQGRAFKALIDALGEKGMAKIVEKSSQLQSLFTPLLLGMTLRNIATILVRQGKPSVVPQSACGELPGVLGQTLALVQASTTGIGNALQGSYEYDASSSVLRTVIVRTANIAVQEKANVLLLVFNQQPKGFDELRFPGMGKLLELTKLRGQERISIPCDFVSLTPSSGTASPFVGRFGLQCERYGERIFDGEDNKVMLSLVPFDEEKNALRMGFMVAALALAKDKGDAQPLGNGVLQDVFSIPSASPCVVQGKVITFAILLQRFAHDQNILERGNNVDTTFWEQFTSTPACASLLQQLLQNYPDSPFGR